MSSTFYGLEIAKTGLYASQQAVDLTGHNISNANTPGYTRQRLDLTAQELTNGYARFEQYTRGTTGAGVKIEGVEQIRDAFLDTQFRNESGSQQMWSAKSDALGYIQQLFNVTGDSSLSQSINDFFASVQTLASNPESEEYRTNLMQTGMKMTEDFQHISSELADKQVEQNDAVGTTVQEINDTAQNIADLNDQIFRYEVNGEKANDLRDQRNQLLDNLAGMTDISYSEDANGEETVQIGGQVLVSGNTAHKIVASATLTNPIAGGPKLYDLTWADYVQADGVTPAPVVTTSGKLRAYLDLRDGNSTANQGIPFILSGLDTLASSITTEFNAIHRAGYTMPDASNGNTSVNGVNFFTEANGVPVTAANFSVDAGIQANVFNIAAAGSQITSQALIGDNTNALALGNLQTQINLPGIGSIDGYLSGYVSSIGVETEHTNQMRNNEQVLVDSITNQRQSVSGVSTDEEMTNLIKYQHSYEASARVITTIDDYLDTLINKMGLVGR